MYTFNWALTTFRSESYIGSATALPDTETAVLTSTSCDKLLVAVTQRMTELAAGRVYTAIYTVHTACLLILH